MIPSADEMSKTGKPIKTKSKLVVASGWEEGKWGDMGMEW